MSMMTRSGLGLLEQRLIAGRYQLKSELVQSEQAEQHRSRSRDAGSRFGFKSDKARVYLAIDTVTGRKVALKLLEAWSAIDRQLKSRFDREVQTLETLARIDHPNIVRFLGAGISEDDRPYFVMEYLQGRTLGDWIATEGPISPDDLVDVLNQIGSALDAAHAQGVVHRDINPYNIMIEETENGPRVKLMDFGLAKSVARASQGGKELTSAGTALGTAAYMSPEQAKGDLIDARSDVYSLGATLFEVLTGRLPYHARTEIEAILAHASQPVPQMPENWWFGDRRAGSVEAVIRKALSKSPADRQPGASVLATEFRNAVAGRGYSLPLGSKAQLFRGVLVAAGILLTITFSVIAFKSH